MALEGYLEYQRREFCKDVRCPVQMELMTKPEGSQEYERLQADLPGGVPIHHLAVSPLAYRQRVPHRPAR